MGKIRRTISKLIPKEIKPILPYAALFIPGLQGAAGAFAKMGITNALAQKAIIAAATKGLSDDKAKFGDIARTAALAVAPDVIQQGLGSLGNAITPQTTQALKASMSVTGGGNAIPLTQQVGQAATAAAESEFLNTLVNPGTLTQTAKAIASPALTDYSIKQREIQKQELEKYNEQLRERGVTDKIGRRKGIYDIYASIEDEDDSGTYRVYSDDYINSILDKYGYKNGGRIGFEAGGEVAALMAEVKRLQSENAELKSKSGLKEVREGIDYATKGFEQAFGSPLMGQMPSPQRIVPGFGLMNGGRVNFEIGGNVSPTDSSEEGIGGVIYEDEDGNIISKKEAMDIFNKQAEEEAEERENKFKGGRIGYRDAGYVGKRKDSLKGGGYDSTLSFNPLEDDINSLLEGGGSSAGIVSAMLRRNSGAMTAAGETAKKGLNKSTIELTKKESKYLKELINDTGGGKFKAEILEEVPSLLVKNNKLTVKQRDLDSFSKYLDDVYISELAPSGRGANLMPPRLRSSATSDKSVIGKLFRENKAAGGLMELKMGGMPSMEMDYRGGGFIPVGAKEKADDVPARLSKNEFVMTADAVRAAGGGSVNEGARRMYELMNSLEARV
jgi:hypothetical protein